MILRSIIRKKNKETKVLMEKGFKSKTHNILTENIIKN